MSTATDIGLSASHTVTVEKAAEIIGISRRHAYHLVATGEIPSVRLGKSIRIPSFRLIQMLEGTGEAAA